MKAKMYQSHNGLIYRANGDEIQVLNPQVNNEWRASVLMMETAKKSDRPLQEILDRKAALNGWQPWEEPEESAAPQSNAVQLAEDVLDTVKHHKGELTADGCRQAVGKSYFSHSGLDSGGYQCSPRGVKLAPKGEEFMDFTWSKFVKFCRDNGLIEEESIKCNHKPAQSAAAAATMAGTAPQSAPIASDAQSSPCPSSGADVPTEEKTPLNSHCKTGKSPSGHCGAAAYCSEPYDCCAQCPNDCNSRCGWIPAKEESVCAKPVPKPAAAPVSSEVQPLASSAFDYTGLDVPTVDTLRWAEREICDARRDYVARLAQAVYIAHDALLPVANCDGQRLNNNQHSEKTFIQWCASVGLGKDTAYRLLQVAALLNGSTPEEQAVLEAASPSLLYAAAKPSAPAQLVQGVKSGDITTHKQYQDLLARLKAKEQELADEKAAHQSESAAFSELFADEQRLRQQAEEARIKAEKAARGAKESYRAVKKNELFQLQRANDAENQRAMMEERERFHLARIAELEARPVEVVGADPDEIERRAQVLAEQKTAQIQAELAKVRAEQKTSDSQSDRRAVYDAVILAAQAMDAAWKSLVPVLTQLAPVEKRETIYKFVNQLMCMKEDALKMIQTEEAPDADHQN